MTGALPSDLSLWLADDSEIERFARLFDRLGIGLLLHASDGSLCLRNAQAEKQLGQLGDAPPCWVDEGGQPLPADEWPAMQALRSGQPVHDRVLGLRGGRLDGDAPNLWLKTSALPIWAADGSIRRVLTTLMDISKHKQLESEVEGLSIRDRLTGAFNMAYLRHQLEEEIHRARRYGTPFTLALLEVDGLRRIAEDFGQASADRVLVGTAEEMLKGMREIDIVAYRGDGQFLLVLPNVRQNEGMVGLERVRAQVGVKDLTENGSPITLSGGVTEYSGESSAILIERAVSLLEHARDAGHNHICQDVDIF